jgi:hypothetical protein
MARQTAEGGGVKKGPCSQQGRHADLGSVRFVLSRQAPEQHPCILALISRSGCCCCRLVSPWLQGEVSAAEGGEAGGGRPVLTVRTQGSCNLWGLAALSFRRSNVVNDYVSRGECCLCGAQLGC